MKSVTRRSLSSPEVEGTEGFLGFLRPLVCSSRLLEHICLTCCNSKPRAHKPTKAAGIQGLMTTRTYLPSLLLEPGPRKKSTFPFHLLFAYECLPLGRTTEETNSQQVLENDFLAPLDTKQYRSASVRLGINR